MRKNGVNTGNPIQNIKDYGFEVGGPIVKGRAWYWGSYGKQNINVGINNFFKAEPNCQAMKAAPLTYSLEEIRTCLSPDTTLLNNYNAKFSWQIVRANQFSFYWNGAEKVRNARDASDLRPLETTYRQIGVSDSSLGSSWWKTGMPKTYKWSDRHVFSDRFMIEASYSHVGNNFALTFHEDSLASVQPLFEITTSAYARSFQESVFVRPTDSIDVISNYFLPGVLGGDHALKFGFKYRNDKAYTRNQWGGDAISRTRNGAASEADLYRKSITEYGLRNRNFYVQDSYSRNRLTVNFGIRFDHQSDFADPNTAPASPFFGKATYAGVYNGVTYTGANFNQLPALSFQGKNTGIVFKNWSPRIGAIYDLRGDGRSVAKFNYSRYVSQLGSGGTLAGVYNTVASTFVRYPWVDLSGDKIIQANEIVLTAAPLSWTGGYDYNNPSATSTTGTVDPGLRMETTNEILVSFDKQIGQQFAVSASYIWRKYGDFRWDDRLNWTSANYVQNCVHAGADGLPVRRALRHGHLLPADEPDPDRIHPHEPAGLLAQLQRLRGLGAQADGQPLDGQCQLRVQRRARALRLVGGVRGPDEHREPQRRPVRRGVDLERPRQRVRQRQVDLPGVGSLHDASVGHQRVGLLQLPQRLSIHPVHPDVDAALQRRHRDRLSRSVGR